MKINVKNTVFGIPKESLKKLQLSHWLFFLGLLMKPFYLLPSGSFQTGDLLLMLAVGIHYATQRKVRVRIRKDNKPFFFFFGMVILINLAYTVITGTTMLKPIAYYLYNFLIILYFSDVLEDDEHSETFLLLIRLAFFFDILFQYGSYMLGRGKWFSSSRYMGTFNDPNQYGVFILIASLSIFVISVQFKKNWLIMLGIGFLAILPSSSTGMLCGMLAFVGSYFIFSLIKNDKKSISLFFILLILSILVLCIAFGYIELPEIITKQAMYKRFLAKIRSVLQSSNRTIADDRCWNAALRNPIYFLYGAGEGGFSRFNAAHEIHSSILGPLFYYGIVPFTSLCIWVGRKLRGIKVELYSAYVAIIAEAVFLVNTRQPTFWMLFLLAGYKLSKKNNNELRNRGI